jgi:cation/acetate symporter
MIPVLFVIAITVITIGLGIWATRMSRTASDFFVAGRSVNVFWNASAISGEYLSAASFMGIAGMLMKNGYDVLWYPVCYATGYLFLLLFIAGPLRRFGAYTIPDFAEGRFDSPLFRKIAVTFVLFIGFFYTMPQMKGAGLVMGSIMDWPYWMGIAVVGSVITFNVALGGMKGITFVQAFQYWAKMFAISVPIFVLMSVFGGYNAKLGENQERPRSVPRIKQDIPNLNFGAGPANAITFPTAGGARITFTKGVKIAKQTVTREPRAGENPIAPVLTVEPDPSGSGAVDLVGRAAVITKGIRPVVQDGIGVRASAKVELAEPADKAILRANSYVPNAPSNQKWLEPFGTLSSKYGHPLLYTYSLIIALICGTAGLPHILVRFYTNPDGRAAKRTTLWVMVLIGTFYLFPPIWGALGRSVMPQLYATGKTDTIVIQLPGMLQNKLLGDILKGITSAGAFAAFMSTFSGLLVSMSGALAHDIYGKMIRPNATPQQRLAAFKVAAIVFGAISMVLGFMAEKWDINMMVGWAFAIAAASYFPLLLLGSWWRGLTMPGAATGMLAGGLLSLGAIVCHMLIDLGVLSWQPDPMLRTVMEQPAIWGVPLALGVMFIVSKLTARHVPADASLKMLRLHAPEEMGLSKNYIEH